MASDCTITFTVTFPWWARHYITVLAWCAETFGTDPDPDKAAALLMRHTKIKPNYRGHVPPRPLPMPPHLHGYQPTATQPGLSTAHPPKRP